MSTFHLFEDDASAASPYGPGGGGRRTAANVLHSIFSPPQQKKAAAAAAPDPEATTAAAANEQFSAVAAPPASNSRRQPPPPPPPPPPPRQSFQQQMRGIRAGDAVANSSHAAVPQKSAAACAPVAMAGGDLGRPVPPPPPPPPRQEIVAATAAPGTTNAAVVAPASSVMASNGGGGQALSSIPEVQHVQVHAAAPPPLVASQPSNDASMQPTTTTTNASTQVVPTASQQPILVDSAPAAPVAQVVDATTSPSHPHKQNGLAEQVQRQPNTLTGTSAYASPPKDIGGSPSEAEGADGAGGLFLSPISVLTEATRPSVFQHGNNNAGMFHGSGHGAVPTLSVTRTVAGNGSGGGGNGNGGGGSVVTYRNAVPIDMLDVGYVTQCTSAKELERIVDVLVGEGHVTRYPSLLRIARARLTAVRGAAGSVTEAQQEQDQRGQNDENEPHASGIAGNAILSRVRSESFHSAVDPTPAAAVLPAATKVSAAGSTTTAPPASLKIAPLVISTGKRVNFAAVPVPLPTGRSLDTPRSVLAGFALVDDDAGADASTPGAGSAADTLNMDLTPSSYGGSVRSRLSRASSIRVTSTSRPGVSIVGAGGVGGLTPIQKSPFAAAAASTGIVDVAPAMSPYAATTRSHVMDDSATGSDDTEGTDNELKDNFASVLVEHSMLKSQINAVVDERDQLKVRLASQTVELRDLQGRMARQEAGFASKSKFLEDAKVRVESDLASLVSRRVDSSNEAREIMVELKTKEREIFALREEIRLVKEKRRKEFEASSELHDELLAEISYCTEELTAQKRRHAEALRALEDRLNSEFKEVLEQQQNKVNLLTENLYSSQVEVERLQKQKDELSRALKAIRTNKGQNTLSRVDRKKEVDEAVANATASGAAANAMAKALAISEKELIEAQEQKVQVERECQILQEETAMLLQENRKLSDRIKILDEEASNSNGFIETLLSQVNHLEAANHESSEAAFTTKQKLLSVERNYQSELSQLQAELSEKKNWVSSDLYKKAVRDVKRRDEEILRLKTCRSKSKKSCKKKKSEGVILSPLALEIARASATDKENRDVPRQVTVCRKAKGPRNVSPTNSSDDSKSPASTGGNQVNVDAQGKALGTKSLARLNALRAAGGKKALAERLKKVRGSTPFTSPQ